MLLCCPFLSYVMLDVKLCLYYITYYHSTFKGWERSFFASHKFIAYRWKRKAIFSISLEKDNFIQMLQEEGTLQLIEKFSFSPPLKQEAFLQLSTG